MDYQSINPKYKKDLDRLYKADRKYCEFVDKNMARLDALDPDSDKYYRLTEAIEDAEAIRYNDYRERFVDHLPERELKAWAKRYESFHGYAPYLV